MPSRFILPFADVGSGILPSSGSKLYFYAAGTTTPKDTHTTKAATTANSNPLVSDSKGVFPDIFITGSYKVILKDKNNVQKWEADPVDELSVGDADTNLINDLSQAYMFPTVAAFKDSLIVFPTGKTIATQDYDVLGDAAGGEYLVTAGTTPDAIKSPQLVSGYAKLVQGAKKFDETYGGVLFDGAQVVTAGDIYENKIFGDDNYGSFMYFDAPDQPAPTTYNLSYKGSPKNGVFGFTWRDATRKGTWYGYRAGHDSTSDLSVYLGVQAGESSADVKVDSITGGSVGIGVTALFESTANSIVAIGLEAGSRCDSGQTVYIGSFAGNGVGVVGDRNAAVGYKAMSNATNNDTVAVGHEALITSSGSSCVAVGKSSQNSASGNFNVGVGVRTLSQVSGANNTAIGYEAGYVPAGMTASNVTFVGHQAGEGNDNDGSTSVGRDALATTSSSATFSTALGYLAGQNTTYARCVFLGQASQVTGNDQVQLGAAATTTYAYGAIQDRSDRRDKLDILDLTDAHIAFFMEVEWKQYRMNYRESYRSDTKTPLSDYTDNDGSKAGTRFHIGAVAQQVDDAMKKHGIDFAGLQHHSINGGDDVYSLGYQEFIGIQGVIIQRQQARLLSIEDRLTKAGI